MTIKELKELIIKLEVVLNHNSVIKPCDYPKYEGLKIVKLRLFKGNRIAQLVIVPLPAVHLIEGDVTGVKSKRGLGGFESSGA